MFSRLSCILWQHGLLRAGRIGTLNKWFSCSVFIGTQRHSPNHERKFTIVIPQLFSSIVFNYLIARFFWQIVNKFWSCDLQPMTSSNPVMWPYSEVCFFFYFILVIHHYSSHPSHPSLKLGSVISNNTISKPVCFNAGALRWCNNAHGWVTPVFLLHSCYNNYIHSFYIHFPMYTCSLSA